METIKTVNIKGKLVKVAVNVIEESSGVFRASARYCEYYNSPVSIHKYTDEKVAINVAVNKLIRDCPFEILKHI